MRVSGVIALIEELGESRARAKKKCGRQRCAYDSEGRMAGAGQASRAHPFASATLGSLRLTV